VQRDWAQGLADSGFCVGHDGKNRIETGYIWKHRTVFTARHKKVLTASAKMKFTRRTDRVGNGGVPAKLPLDKVPDK